MKVGVPCSLGAFGRKIQPPRSPPAFATRGSGPLLLRNTNPWWEGPPKVATSIFNA